MVKPDWVWISDSKRRISHRTRDSFFFNTSSPSFGIKERLWRCFRHMKANPIYGHHVMVMLLVVHLIIGHRRLRDVDYYRDDEMVKRVLGPEAIAGRVHRQPLARQCRCTKRRQSPSRVEHCGHGALGGRTIRERNARLRRLGVEHRAPCRRHGSGVQQEKERCAQLLPPVLHRRPDRPSARCASSARQCPRLQRCRHLHRALCAYRAREPASGK